MPELMLHPQTTEAIDAFLAHPTHALLLIGPKGIGKRALADKIAADILGVGLEKIGSQPYVTSIEPQKAASISIDAVRELEHVMSLRIPGGAGRIAIIEDAHLLTIEAQNALLKTLEEPPERATIILTAATEQALLPTIRSRVHSLQVQRPATIELMRYHENQGVAKTKLQSAMLMSGGLPGLLQALLDEDMTHPLITAAATARELIQKTTFERLGFVDTLAKQREACLDVLEMLQQMSHVALASSPKSSDAFRHWQRTMQAAYNATEALLGSAQPKLVLTNLMLDM